MISWNLILEAAALTAGAVVFATASVRWRALWMSAAAAGSFGLILGWRAIANAAGLNDDFARLVSVGDCGCLIAGALAPGAVAWRLGPPAWRHALPPIVGGLAGFVVNVVIL